METSKLKAKRLTMIDLVDLFLKAELASDYYNKFQTKIESFGYCQKWARKLDHCTKSLLIVQQEMRDLLEKEGAFKEVGG